MSTEERFPARNYPAYQQYRVRSIVNLTSEQQDFINACENNNRLSVVAFLNNRNFNPNFFDSSGRTAIFAACRRGQTSIVQMLQIDGRVNTRQVDNFRITPLHVACANNRVETVTQLLLGDIDINAVDIFGASPLSDACQEGNYPIITNLLADPRLNADIVMGALASYYYSDNESEEGEVNEKEIIQNYLITWLEEYAPEMMDEWLSSEGLHLNEEGLPEKDFPVAPSSQVGLSY